MATVLDICNRALTRLGQYTITDINGNSTAPRLCKQHYDSVRLQLLRAHPWNFAMKREPLAQHNDAPRFGPAFQYHLPPGCVSAVAAFYDLDGRIRIDRFSIENGELLTDSDQCYLLYVHDYTDPAYWDPVFTEAVVVQLAARIAVPMGREDIMPTLIQELEQVIMPKAMLYNAWEDSSNENSPVMDFINGATINRVACGIGYGLGLDGPRPLDTSPLYTNFQ